MSQRNPIRDSIACNAKEKTSKPSRKISIDARGFKLLKANTAKLTQLRTNTFYLLIDLFIHLRRAPVFPGEKALKWSDLAPVNATNPATTKTSPLN